VKEKVVTDANASVLIYGAIDSPSGAFTSPSGGETPYKLRRGYLSHSAMCATVDSDSACGVVNNRSTSDTHSCTGCWKHLD
jgi:hypothetical protein